jgi:hypothetical protein
MRAHYPPGAGHPAARRASSGGRGNHHDDHPLTPSRPHNRAPRFRDRTACRHPSELWLAASVPRAGHFYRAAPGQISRASKMSRPESSGRAIRSTRRDAQRWRLSRRDRGPKLLQRDGSILLRVVRGSVLEGFGDVAPVTFLSFEDSTLVDQTVPRNLHQPGPESVGDQLTSLGLFKHGAQDGAAALSCAPNTRRRYTTT